MGVAWAIVWFLVVKSSPAEDPNISEEERLYIESSLANDAQKKVDNIPVECHNILVLIIVYYKGGSRKFRKRGPKTIFGERATSLLTHNT